MAIRSLCSLYGLKRSDRTDCTPSMPGTGDRIYVFDIDQCFGDNIPLPVESQDTSNDTKVGFYNATNFIGNSSRGLTKGKVAAIDIKSNSGQVTSEKGEDVEGRSLVGTAIIDHSIKEFLKVDEAMAFRNMGALFADGNGNYYVIMSPYARTKYSSNYDSGTTYDSDHGFTITFTATPVFFGCPKVKLTESDLKSVLINSTQEIEFGNQE